MTRRLKYTKIPVDTFEKLTLNAGIIVDSFDPATGTYTNILGATTGNTTFIAKPLYDDLAEGVNNAKLRTREMMIPNDYEVTLAGTMLTVDAGVVSRLLVLADVDGEHITPRLDLDMSDFKDIWLIADYGVGGYIAIHMRNTISTDGFQIQTGDRTKGQFPFTFTAHFSIDEPDIIPFDIYIHTEEADEGE